MCEIKIFGLKFVVCLGTLVQDGLAHMRGVICSGEVQNRDVWDENFRIEVCSVSWDVGSGWVGTHAWKTGMCEMKNFGSEICSVSWDVGSGWVGSHAWCNMESCSGKVQKRDIKIRTTSESPRLLGESVSKYFHANKASVEKLWQTQKLGGMKRVWLTVLWGSFDFIV